MKMTKRFVALLMAVAMCMSMMSMSAFAAEVPKEATNDTKIALPDDAEILYEDDTIIFYQSNQQKEGSFVPYSTRSGEMTYNSVWLTNNKSGDFSVKNPNPGGKIYGTIRVECDNTSAFANIFVSCKGMVSGYVYAAPAGDSKNDTYFCIKDTSSYNEEASVKYYPTGASSSHGMRINCWIYLDKPDTAGHQYWESN